MEIRYQTGQPLRISLLDSGESHEGRVVRMVGRLAEICVSRPFPLGAPLRINFDDCVILGEVAACLLRQPDYVITIHVCDAVPIMSDLGRLISAVMTSRSQPRAQERMTSQNISAGVQA